MNIYQVLIKPLITEKGNFLQESQNQIMFAVHPDANKIEIRQAVEQLFDTKVLKVNVTNMRGKVKRIGRWAGKRPNWKKAIVTLAEGETVEFFEGV